MPTAPTLVSAGEEQHLDALPLLLALLRGLYMRRVRDISGGEELNQTNHINWIKD